MLIEPKLKIGSELPEFNLKATDSNKYSASTFSNSKILVIMFTCNHCPYVRSYEERLINLQDNFKKQGISFLAINSNDEINYPEDSFENMIKRADEKKYNFPYLRDEDQSVAKDFGT